MSSLALRTLALTMALVAILLGYFAFKASKDMQATGVPQDGAAVRLEDGGRARFKAVIAVKSIVADRPVPSDAVSLEPVTVMPDGGFGRLEDVIGKMPASFIAVGEPLAQRHFRRGGSLAQSVRPGERAVGVMVNDVIGAGGFVQPGDHVDVLLYLASDARQLQDTQAQVLLRRLRVLAYDDAATAQEGSKPRTGAHTAVLAVPERDVARLMLGASAGMLRFALHGSTQDTDGSVQATASQGKGQEVRTAGASAAQGVTLRQLAVGGPAQPSAPAGSASGRTVNRTVIHYGTQTKTVRN